MRKQASYSDDFSLLGRRVRPLEPRNPTSTSGDKYRLYSPTSGGDHPPHGPPKAGATEITFTFAKSGCKKTTSKAPSQRKPVYAVKINNLDDVTIPVASVQLEKIEEARSVHELQELLHSYTSKSSSSAAGAPRHIKPASSRNTLGRARTTGIRVYERCFLQHCTTLRDALGD